MTTITTCGSCGALVDPKAKRCHQCGRLWPALLGLRPGLDRLFSREHSFSKPFALFLVVVYLATVLVGQRTGNVGPGLLEKFNPGPGVTLPAGVAYTPFILGGDWWRTITACLLHAGIVHILFNCFALFNLGRIVEQIYGNARLTIVLFVSGVVGYVVGLPFVPMSLGASGAICGLIGAVLAFGFRRGGTHGEMIRGQALQWILYLAVFGFVVSGINNYAHFGGAAGGFAAAWFFDAHQLQKGKESDRARLIAIACILVTLLAIGMAFYTMATRVYLVRTDGAGNFLEFTYKAR